MDMLERVQSAIAQALDGSEESHVRLQNAARAAVEAVKEWINVPTPEMGRVADTCFDVFWAAGGPDEISAPDMMLSAFKEMLAVAFESSCCAGGPQWGHAWDCRVLNQTYATRATHTTREG